METVLFASNVTTSGSSHGHFLYRIRSKGARPRSAKRHRHAWLPGAGCATARPTNEGPVTEFPPVAQMCADVRSLAPSVPSVDSIAPLREMPRLCNPDIRAHTKAMVQLDHGQEEAPVGFEPTMADLQSAALATWLRRHDHPVGAT